MLLELCVTELEDVASDRVCGRLPQPVIQESPHPYSDDASLSGTVKIPGKLCLCNKEIISKYMYQVNDIENTLYQVDKLKISGK